MKTAAVVQTKQGQTVQLPDEFHFRSPTVSIRREGQAVILEPIKAECWPDGFFAAVHIDDPAFARPEQGFTPPAPSLG